MSAPNPTVPAAADAKGVADTKAPAAASAAAAAAPAKAVVWPAAFKQAFGTEFVNNKGDKVDAKFFEGKTFALYFSAHWCPPCRAFTPELVKTYNKIKADKKDFELVFVSSDRDQHSFNEYFATMPWHAIPFADRARARALGAMLGVQGIPSLAIFDGNDASIITKDGRSAVSADPHGKNFPWVPKPCNELTSSTVQAFAQNPSLVLFLDVLEEWTCSGCTFRNGKNPLQCEMCSSERLFVESEAPAPPPGAPSPAECNAAQAALEQVAAQVVADSKQAGKASPLHFFYSRGDPVVGRVKEIGDIKNEAFVIVDLENKKKYSTNKKVSELNAAALQQIVQDFVAGKIPSVPLRLPQEDDE